MSNAWELKRFRSNSWNAMKDEQDKTMFDVVYAGMTEFSETQMEMRMETQEMEKMKAEETAEETGTSVIYQMMALKHKKMDEDVKVVLQQLIIVGRLPCDPAGRTELGASYENFNAHLSKQHMSDKGITGLLLMYPTCLLHVIEGPEHMLNSFLKDFQAMQQQPDWSQSGKTNRAAEGKPEQCELQERPTNSRYSSQLEAKIVFVGHNLEGRQFQQWRYKVMNAGPDDGNPVVRRLDEDEDSIESLVCSVLTPLQNLVPHVETSDKAFPGSVLDENQEILIPAVILERLLGRDELLNPQQYHQMYHNPLNINPEYGQVNLRSFF